MTFRSLPWLIMLWFTCFFPLLCPFLCKIKCVLIGNQMNTKQNALIDLLHYYFFENCASRPTSCICFLLNQVKWNAMDALMLTAHKHSLKNEETANIWKTLIPETWTAGSVSMWGKGPVLSLMHWNNCTECSAGKTTAPWLTLFPLTAVFSLATTFFPFQQHRPQLNVH